MITANQLHEINKDLKTIDQKGKAYVMVNERVKAFRRLCAEGSLTTEILHLDDEKVVMKSTVTDDEGRILATGIASEKFNSDFITRTSAFEVCETSSIGRALGFVGIGIDGSMASAEEVANAILQQNQPEPATASEKKTFKALCDKYSQNPDDVLTKVGCKNHSKMTKDDYAKALVILKDIADSVNG